jgi:integrase
VSKTEAGTDRIVPLDDEAEAGIRAYMRFERPRYAGEGPEEFNDAEPLFLNHEGKGFRSFGWTRRAQNLRRDLAGPASATSCSTVHAALHETTAEARRASPSNHASGRLEERDDADAIHRQVRRGRAQSLPTANLRSLLRA